MENKAFNQEAAIAELNKTLKNEVTLDTIKEVFAYLKAVRDIGSINMLLAASYLVDEFKFHHRDAIKIFWFWARNINNF